MSAKRSLFDVIENGKEIENDINLTSMEKISEGVDKLVDMTKDAFDHLQSLEDAIEQTDALASKTKRELDTQVYENRARYGALADRISKLAEQLSDIQKCTILLLEQTGEIRMANFLKDQRKKQLEEKEETPY